MNSLVGRIAAGRVARVSLLVDVLMVFAALAAAAGLSSGLSPSLVTVGLVAATTWLFVALTLRHYDAWAPDRAALDDAAMTSVIVLAVATAVAVSSDLLTVDHPASGGLFLLVLWPAAIGVRFSIFRSFSVRTGPVDEVLVVGTGALARATAADLRRDARHAVLGFVRFADEKAPKELRGKVLGNVAELEGVLKGLAVGEVYLASTDLGTGAEMQSAIKVCERLGVPFAMPAWMFRLDRARPLASHGIVDGYVHYQSVPSRRVERALKRAFDVLSSAVALWVLSPLLLGVAALIRLTSQGPVLFRQVRVGMHGRPFRMLKFRTMVVDAEALKARLDAANEMDGPVFKMKHDPRITPLGRFLRKYSIDELPQLVNVLRGDMSVVGPRPPVPNEVARYEPWQRRRLSVRPGLTCIWQVSGRNQISFERWMYMDLQYIDNWTLASDVGLVLKTFPVVLTGHGAS